MREEAMALTEAEDALRDFGMALPEATEDFPWGHRALKVRGKAFVFVALEDGELRISTKLPLSSEVAMHLPFAAPTGYGLGAHGWISSRFRDGDEIPMPLLESWILESYRAVAPKRLVKRLPEGAGGVTIEVVGMRRPGESS